MMSFSTQLYLFFCLLSFSCCFCMRLKPLHISKTRGRCRFQKIWIDSLTKTSHGLDFEGWKEYLIKEMPNSVTQLLWRLVWRPYPFSTKQNLKLFQKPRSSLLHHGSWKTVPAFFSYNTPIIILYIPRLLKDEPHR